MGKFSNLYGLVVLGMILHSQTRQAEATNTVPTIACTDTQATLTFTATDLDDLGVCDANDFLVINSVETVTTVAGCSYPETSGAGSFTWDINTCGPDITQDDTSITYQWFARNVAGGQVKRINGCHSLTCTYRRCENATVTITASITKTTLDAVNGADQIALTMETFSDSARTAASTAFASPATVYVQVSIADTTVSSNFVVQIRDCWVLDVLVGTTQSYTIVENGVAINTDGKANVVLGGFTTSGFQNLEFDSFIWNAAGVANANQLVILCKVFLCNEDATGIDCTAAAFPTTRRRRAAIVEDDMMREVVVGPIKVQ